MQRRGGGLVQEGGFKKGGFTREGNFFFIFFLERETYQRGRDLVREGKLPEKETDQRGGSSAREFIREGGRNREGMFREGVSKKG